MSTRGIVGFASDGEIKVMSGIDAHPSGMGADAFDFVQDRQKEILSGETKEVVSNIKLVKPGD